MSASKKIILIISFVTTLLLLAAPADAAKLYFDPLGGGLQTGNLSGTGLGSTTPTIIAAQTVNVLLQVLGLFTLVVVLYGGYLWIWARGNSEQIEKAKEILRGTFIGLIIILASYGIMQWVFYYLTRITDAV